MRSTPGVLEVGVNALARRVVLGFDPRQVALSGLLAALARLGYTPHPLTAEMIDSQRQRESRDAMKRLAVAGLGTMQAMMMAVALYAGVFDGIDPAVREFFRWLGFLVATPVVLYSAQPFFRGALREWRSRRLSMDTPVALAIGLIYLASLVGVLVGGHEIYFDSVSMFVLFLLLGRHLAMRARHRAGDVVDALARLQPALAERREGSASSASPCTNSSPATSSAWPAARRYRPTASCAIGPAASTSRCSAANRPRCDATPGSR